MKYIQGINEKSRIKYIVKAMSFHRDWKTVSEKKVSNMNKIIFAPASSRFFRIESKLLEQIIFRITFHILGKAK